MSRNKTSSENVKSNIQQPCNSWVVLLNSEILDGSESCAETPDIETLRHPNTGESALFLFSPDNKSLYEILTYCEDKRSWFIDESVKSDGTLRLTTLVDPIFLVLPYLRKHCTNQAVPLEQILHDDTYPATDRLLKCTGLKNITSVADKKGNDDLTAFKYNEEKTLAWLKKKTERVSDVLNQKNIHATSDATSSTFKKVDGKADSDNIKYLHYAAGIVSEYLEDDLSQKLFKYLNLPEELQPILKRKSEVNDIREVKKIKSVADDITKTTTPTMSKPNLKSLKSSSHTPRTKSQMKASGTKSITSFLKKS